MTSDHSSESEGRQLTVAELLAQHGGEGRGSRRRRRAEDDEPPDTAAGSASAGSSKSSKSDKRSDELPRRVPGGGGFPAPEQDSQLPPPSVSTGSTPVVPNYSSQPYGDQSYSDQSYGDQYGYRDQGTGGFESFGSDAPSGWPGSGTGSFGATGTGATPSVNGHPDSFSFDAYTGTGGFEAQPYQGDIYSTGSDALTPRRPEESTDFIPRYGTASSRSATDSTLTGPLPAVEGGPTTSSGARKAVADTGPGTEFSAPVDLFADDDDEDEDDKVSSATVALGAAGKKAGTKPAKADVADDDDEEEDEQPRSRRSRRAPRRKSRVAEEDVPAGLSAEDADSVEDEPPPTNIKVWLSLAGQLVLGAIGGAALWIGFSYLWQRLPVVALIAAVAATAGLVMLVRAIRRSDDLQTTMLAVLVGLVVTISPAVLLLAVR
ncbi:hypothetical protein [Pseudonocardia spinosispora]|uniref:hypothetical protein n=1 Tax=Pseudonocardia spinosispora TaxID=103441 RepID=UPI00040876B9|nr:hypothetical protein [Pseudonocardia spinosispora]